MSNSRLIMTGRGLEIQPPLPNGGLVKIDANGVPVEAVEGTDYALGGAWHSRELPALLDRLGNPTGYVARSFLSPGDGFVPEGAGAGTSDSNNGENWPAGWIFWLGDVAGAYRRRAVIYGSPTGHPNYNWAMSCLVRWYNLGWTDDGTWFGMGMGLISNPPTDGYWAGIIREGGVVKFATRNTPQVLRSAISPTDALSHRLRFVNIASASKYYFQIDDEAWIEGVGDLNAGAAFPQFVLARGAAGAPYVGVGPVMYVAVSSKL